jgi:hypothetical protein
LANKAYQLSTNLDKTIFTFESFGPKGVITKVVEFRATLNPKIYNMALLDLNRADGSLSDMSRSGNSDIERVLISVYKAMLQFIEHNPDKWIYFTGTTPSRNRLYSIAILKILALNNMPFEVLCEHNKKWIPFEKSINSTAFIVRKKLIL